MKSGHSSMVPLHKRPPALYGHTGFAEELAIQEEDCVVSCYVDTHSDVLHFNINAVT